VFEWPVIGLVMVIFAETSFQILGSEHITGLPLSLGKLLGMLTLVMWALKVMRDRLPLTYTPQLLALLSYIGAMIVVAIVVHPREPSYENGFFKFLQVALLYFLVANIAGLDHRRLILTCAAISAALALCGLIGVFEHFVPSLGMESDDPELRLGAVGGIIDRGSIYGVAIRRITGGLGDANWLAYSLAATLPLNLFWWRRARTLLGAGIVLAAALLQALGLVLSYTRAGFLGLGAAVVYLLWHRVLPLRLVVAGALVAVLIGLVWLPAGFLQRMFSLEYLEEGSTPMRQDLTGTALYFALQRPIFGYGYGQFGVEFMARIDTDLKDRVGAWGFDLARAVNNGQEDVHNIGAHNLYLEVMVEYGLLGLIPFMSFLFLALHDLRLCRRYGSEEDRLLAYCLSAGLIAFYTCGMLGHAKYLKILWLLTGLAAAHRRVVLTEAADQLAPAQSASGRESGSTAPIL
jgi:O-antigen ligase